jgi:N-methylhydantoinase A
VTQVEIGVDVGGTFTDLVAIEDGRVSAAKVPTTPDDQSAGVLDALRAACVEPEDVKGISHGTTVATNALLERRGARTALVTTEGFRDVLEIARQVRPSLYDLAEEGPEPLVPRELRFTVHERVGPLGVIERLSRPSVHDVIAAISAAGVDAVAICLLFSHLYPEHEREVARALKRSLPGTRLSVSSDVLPEFREYERFSTTVADAYLGPRLETYLRSLAHALSEQHLPAPLVMQSSGGVTDVGGAIDRAAACVLSGPAAGVVGAAYLAEVVGHRQVLTLDMGGTSTDVAAVIDGSPQLTTQSIVGGVPIRFPALDVHSVSAGGGSIAWADEGKALRVGPLSSGAYPGPASYGLGGTQPTVTDANLFLGYLRDGALLGGKIRLNRSLAEVALERVANELALSPLQTALGVVRVANVEMARALRVISVERGLDPREFALIAFGGAGPLHACSLAEELDIRRVLVPPLSGVLSALGLAISDHRRDFVTPFRGDLAFAALKEAARRELPDALTQCLVDVRYRGQAFELTVPANDVAANFHAAHERRYGYRMEDEAIEPVNLRLVATVARERPSLGREEPGSEEFEERDAYFGGDPPLRMKVFRRSALGSGSRVLGPTMVEFEHATCVVRPGWAGVVDEVGMLSLERI